MHSFDLKAHTIERSFLRKIKNQATYKTGTGKLNYVTSYNRSVIKIRTLTGKTEQSISRNGLRKAISYLLYKKNSNKTRTRKIFKYEFCLNGITSTDFYPNC
ncbi:hypothetical protein JOD82_002035 [Paenibacillus sp. 1182]|nr:hypothetical protein [Paenibacillus sp. 1182]